MKPTTRVIGIDPGTRYTGWGVVDAVGGAITFVDAGVINVANIEALPDRLVQIHEQLSEVLRRHRPGAAAAEGLFHHKNAMSALKLGHARGVVIMTLARAGLTVGEYAPGEVKRAVAGYGRAGKDEVARMVSLQLGRVGDRLRADATDALAVAMCHALMLGTSARLSL